MNIQEIKNKILTDEEFASKMEYILSKTILDNPPIHKKIFVYKKQKIIFGKNFLYSIYDLNTKQKLYNNIHYEEVAKCVAKNIKKTSVVDQILKAENEFVRFKNKIDFMKKSIQQHYSDIKMSKLSSDLYYYHKSKNDLIKILNQYN